MKLTKEAKDAIHLHLSKAIKETDGKDTKKVKEAADNITEYVENVVAQGTEE